MTDERPAKPDPRRARLEEQLRENLKRRKEQARARRLPSDEERGNAPENEAIDE